MAGNYKNIFQKHSIPNSEELSKMLFSEKDLLKEHKLNSYKKKSKKDTSYNKEEFLNEEEEISRSIVFDVQDEIRNEESDFFELEKDSVEYKISASDFTMEAIDGLSLLTNSSEYLNSLSRIEEKINNQKENKKKRPIIWWYSIAAIFLLFLSIGYFTQILIKNTEGNSSDYVYQPTEEEVDEETVIEKLSESDKKNIIANENTLNELENKSLNKNKKNYNKIDNSIEKKEIQLESVDQNIITNSNNKLNNASGTIDFYDVSLEKNETNSKIAIVPSEILKEELDLEENRIISSDEKVGTQSDSVMIAANINVNKSTTLKKSRSKDSYNPTFPQTEKPVEQNVASSPKPLNAVNLVGYTINDVIKFYDNKKLDSAEIAVDEVLYKQKLNQLAHFYKGLIEKENQKYESALDHFNKVTKDSRRYHDALWHKADIYLMANDKEKAKPILVELSKPGSPYRDDALNALKKL